MCQNEYCGIECVFEYAQDAKSFLQSCMEISERCLFTVRENRVLIDGQMTELPERLSAKELQAVLDSEKTVVLELVLHCYLMQATEARIDTYEDYCHSSCEMLILLSDSAYVDVYCKNKMWLNALWIQAKKIPMADVVQKCEDTDERTEMHV